MSPDARSVGAAAASDPLPPLEPGARYWHARATDAIWVRVQFQPRSKLEVDIWWNRVAHHPDVQLLFGLYEDFIELGCLSGNGFDAPGFHRAGFGTFAVNIAVQGLKAVYPPAFKVQGLLSNTAEDGLPEAERRRLQVNRRAFWHRFGLGVITREDPPLDFLAGTVGDLELVPGGTLAGQFPRCIFLRDFSRTPPAGM